MQLLSLKLIIMLTRSSLKFIKCSRHFCSQNNVNTIFALSSGKGRCGVSVIRVSGPETQDALKLMTNLGTLPHPRKASLRKLANPFTKETLDESLVLWFPGPNSFTGEDCCEFQVHGSPAVIKAVFNVLGQMKNFRMAEPGEFTRRAFYNRKMDLTSVEGLADLLQAETEAQRKQALWQLQGNISKNTEKWRSTLLSCVATIEATIDFSETDTIDSNIDEIVADVRNVSHDIRNVLNDRNRGELLRGGIRTVILGEPNAGKSSVLNYLCKRPAAIVTPIEGTTRDVLDVTLDIDGYPVIVSDTAGLRNTTDIVEKEGIKKAFETYERANIILLLIDLQKYATWMKTNPGTSFQLYIREYLNNINLNGIIETDRSEKIIFKKDCIIILNKFDLFGENNLNIDYDGIITSCKTEEGLTKVVEKLEEKVKALCGESTENAIITQARHRENLTNCLESLNKFMNFVNNDEYDMALLANHLRAAMFHIGKMSGKIVNEDVLDVIFKQFCVGK